MSDIRQHWPEILIWSACAALATVVIDLPGPLRPLVVLWFMLVCPGMAFVRLLALRDGLAESVLAVALSLAISGAASGALMYSGWWTPVRALMLVMGITVAAAAVPLPAPVRDGKNPPPS